eukprot:scaffold274581_cov57-Attheya_sp.AAC.1
MGFGKCILYWEFDTGPDCKCHTTHDKQACIYFKEFALCHNLTMIEQADMEKLPAALVNRRECKLLYRASSLYYHFIRCIESIYLSNLNLANMLAYSSGNLIKVISMKIADNEDIRMEFGEQCVDVPCLDNCQ